jgi:hypothetical protein
LQGAVDTSHFGAAGLVKAFDLAQQLAQQVCASLPPDRKAAIYDAAKVQSVVAARTVSGAAQRVRRLDRDRAAVGGCRKGRREARTHGGGKCDVGAVEER